MRKMRPRTHRFSASNGACMLRNAISNTDLEIYTQKKWLPKTAPLGALFTFEFTEIISEFIAELMSEMALPSFHLRSSRPTSETVI